MIKPFVIRDVQPRPKSPGTKYQCFFCQDKDAKLELLYYYCHDIILMRQCCLQCLHKQTANFLMSIYQNVRTVTAEEQKLAGYGIENIMS
jgi:hypothetical protein